MANPQTLEALIERAEDRVRQLPLDDSQHAFAMADSAMTYADTFGTEVVLAAVHLALARLLARGHAERNAPKVITLNPADGKLVIAEDV